MVHGPLRRKCGEVYVFIESAHWALPEVGCPKILEIRDPWGKVLEGSGFRIEHFCLEVI